MPSPESIQLTRDLRQRLASRALSERQAILYSQRQRIAVGGPGLTNFPGAHVYLEEALILLDCALLEKSGDPTRSSWISGIKRAAELLEWISDNELRPVGAPIHLLSAAAYQLAGYPAMALGLLQKPTTEHLSGILGNFLKADFPGTISAIAQFWSVQTDVENGTESEFSRDALREIVRCIGHLCIYFRTGNADMVARALGKMEALAAGFLNSRDPFSYLLARLTAATSKEYVNNCLWNHTATLQATAAPTTRTVIDQFVRSAYINKRLLVWPAQAVGLERLAHVDSFVLCTPTGSGKTSVATMAIVQNLFETRFMTVPGFENVRIPNLILYLVPSRALAAEVETRLAQDLRGISNEPAVVTGLYGGVDWGPTDAWIQSESPTTVICTFEKADALIRYLGALFLDRVRLVIIDEAHMVEQDISRLSGLSDGSSRSFRLEQLGSRLLYAQSRHNFRVIALSAVAAQSAPAIARWVSSNPQAVPVRSDHRSTRQMLGRLDLAANRQYTIRYDLMDSGSLEFAADSPYDGPFVQSPVPRFPTEIDFSKPQVALRAPALWVALHLAAERRDGSSASVLISLTQSVGPFALSCLQWLIEQQPETLPNYQVRNRDERWTRCLAAAADYFSTESTEYRLLERGIAVHHGKLPGLLARRLKTVIDCGYVRIIIATSTLSEGVNIPVNYLIIPSLIRANIPLSFQEFTNLIGRVGRPGVATEGQALVLLAEGGSSRELNAYNTLRSQMQRLASTTVNGTSADRATSALSRLLDILSNLWLTSNLGRSEVDFGQWLERTAIPQGTANVSRLLSHLDSLDSFLIAAIHEIEELAGAELSGAQLENQLTQIWQRTYAFASQFQEARLRSFWLRRGGVIKQHYADATQRRQIYKSSLPPRAALILVESSRAIKIKLQEGSEYSSWDIERKLNFIGDVLSLLSGVPTFRISKELGRKKSFEEWRTILRWWLAKGSLNEGPKPNEITDWYDFVAQNFIYRSAWGLGGILGLLLDIGDGQNAVRPLEIEDWPRSGLPWIGDRLVTGVPFIANAE